MFVLILKHNNFTFQTHGTAMGVISAPNYANIFMANIEDIRLSTYTGEPKPKLWRRFIADKFFVWEGDEDPLLNSFIIIIAAEALRGSPPNLAEYKKSRKCFHVFDFKYPNCIHWACVLEIGVSSCDP